MNVRIRTVRKMSKPGASSTILLALLLLAVSQVPAHSNFSGPEINEDDEPKWNYIPGSGSGPEDWWRLDPSWGICKCGKRQSPIPLNDAPVDLSLGQLQSYYTGNPAILKNTGHAVSLEWPEGGGYLIIDGTVYTIVESHWHTPAEHTIDGESADLEMHMVHQSPDGKIAVIGILYKIGCEADPFLSQLMEPLWRLVHGQLNNLTVGWVDPWPVNGPQRYYRFMGSLTTPPCTEGVVWTVMKKVLSVSAKQVNLLKAAVNDGINARPLQPINGRRISLSCPWIHDEHPSS